MNKPAAPVVLAEAAEPEQVHSSEVLVLLAAPAAPVVSADTADSSGITSASFKHLPLRR